MAEFDAKLFATTVAEAVACSRQRVTLRFVLEQLGESVTWGF
jgi:hypothetical protein